jgi:hypothetical protein
MTARFDTRADGASRLDSGANCLAGGEESRTWERAGRPSLDQRIDRVARHTRSSSDLFD